MAWTIHPYIGLPYTVRSFMIVVVAGLGNVGGVVVAGLGLGAIENVAGFVFGAEYQIAFVFTLMVLILIWRNWRAARRRSEEHTSELQSLMRLSSAVFCL